MSDPLLYRLGGRGTGKTTRLIKATPSGGVYIVSTPVMSSIVRDYLKTIGREGELSVVSIESAPDQLRGRRTAVAVDHTCLDEGLDTEGVRDAIWGQPLVMTNDYQGDVISTYNPRFS